MRGASSLESDLSSSAPDSQQLGSPVVPTYYKRGRTLVCFPPEMLGVEPRVSTASHTLKGIRLMVHSSSLHISELPASIKLGLREERELRLYRAGHRPEAGKRDYTVLGRY